MNENRWQRLEEIFHRAVELPSAERAFFLDEVCSTDPALRQELDLLLAHDAEEGTTFLGPARGPLGGSAATESLSAGDRLGRYEIVALIGVGGMGEVYRAYDSQLRRHVALKVLPSYLNKDPVRCRTFEQEALTIASLSHPHIAAIYSMEEAGGLYAIAMELVEGSTLAERIERGRIPIGELLVSARQIADALAYAHEKGIVHRDLKPTNIMITGEGHIKLLDFGLAQRVRQEEPGSLTDSRSSEIAGTMGYMSPEQVRGGSVDQRADSFALGVVLYEMVTGERPFPGNSAIVVCDAVLHAEPRDFGDSPAPGMLKAIIRKLLEKDPARRYGSAVEVSQALKELEASLAPVGPARLLGNTWVLAAAMLVTAAVLAGWYWRGSVRERWAHETATPEIERLVDAGEYVRAAALVQAASRIQPKDPTLEKLWIRATGEVSVDSVPPGAVVSIRPYKGDPSDWKVIGKTPLRKARVPVESYVWRVVKPGFAPILFIGKPAQRPPPGYHSGFDLTVKLRTEASVPPKMVVVPGGRVGLTYPLGTNQFLPVESFLIDRHEVTNDEYKKFVDAGGYQRREFWETPFLRDGRVVPWEDAMAFFHDATGHPGPADWDGGRYPKGHANYPVAGVSWYEAAAYARFAGKSLPTAYHWMLASQSASYTPLITPGSNFRDEGTQAVGSESARSGFGTTDMAGNVKEWCWNEARGGKRFILGGGFGELNYMFHMTDAQSPWDRLPNFGFRCVKYDAPPTAATAARIEGTTRDYWKEKPVPDEIFKAYSELYSYDKGELNAQVEDTVSTPSWSRAKVTLDAAYGHEKVTAYLYLPKNALPPFQVVVYFPGAFALMDDKLDLSGLEENRGFLVKSGRALIVPIYKGMYDRRDGLVPGGKPPAFFRDHVIAWAKDLGRSIDYLETRKDIDILKLAYLGESLGGAEGALLPAVERRIKVEILLSGGFMLRHDLPEVDPFNFVEHVTIPVLMLAGRYDTNLPLESSQRPLFHFLGTPSQDKKLVIYEGGHGTFPRPAAVRESLDWLDNYLGSVRR